jgi:hypothetical protein
VGPFYSEQQRLLISRTAEGKTVRSLEWVPPAVSTLDGCSDPGYWVMTFTDSTEITFRFMTEILGATTVESTRKPGPGDTQVLDVTSDDTQVLPVQPR